MSVSQWANLKPFPNVCKTPFFQTWLVGGKDVQSPRILSSLMWYKINFELIITLDVTTFIMQLVCNLHRNFFRDWVDDIKSKLHLSRECNQWKFQIHTLIGN